MTYFIFLFEMSNEVFEMDLATSPPSPPSHIQAMANSPNEEFTREKKSSNELFPNPFLDSSAQSNINAQMDADATIGTLEPQVIF